MFINDPTHYLAYAKKPHPWRKYMGVGLISIDKRFVDCSVCRNYMRRTKEKSISYKLWKWLNK